ncbi:Putative transcriptional regulatory protein, LysR family [Hyphomicrobiales bacterium]|nr:Putative transcriptional regulatory protein, LysR family [Hyphomicrobiales bacterium]CAH1676758.1 putative transcriptional regulatory protein, LysR family [Hyphomicrobiales bacterium]
MLNVPLPSLTALKAFEAVGRLGSVRAAGDELAVSHTVISRHLRHLQESLDITLMVPRGRNLVLTDEGRSYHQEVCKAFAILKRATSAARARRPTKLSIWCTPGIVSRRLLSHLPKLTASPRNWDVNLQPTLAQPNLLDGEADAAIIYADITETDARLRVEDLVRPRVFPVASPSFLEQFLAPETLERLAVSVLLHEESTLQWERWLSLAGLSGKHSLGGQRLWHAHLAIEAARLGQGIALANELLVEDELRSGALVEIMTTKVFMGSYQLVTCADRWNEPAIAVLRQWLQETLKRPE